MDGRDHEKCEGRYRQRRVGEGERGSGVMARILTKLRIDEVSAVDRGAGDGVKIVLMKRDDGGSDDWAREQREISERMNREHVARYDRSFNGVMAKAVADRDELDRNDGDGATNHPIVQIATLLVASGKFSNHTQALDHLLNSPHGNALLARLHKAADQTEKESPMSSLQDVAKTHGVAGVVEIAKNITNAEKSYSLTEEEFVKLIDTAARVTHPELGVRAFEKVYERNPVLASAIAVIKAGLAEQLLSGGMPVQVVGGEDAQDVNGPSAALAALHRIGRERWPESSEAVRFTRAFEANPDLAKQAHVRPSATTSYEFPR
jgi:hypothetical protein